MPFSSLRSDSGTDIVSRFTRPVCKPAGCSVWLRLYSDCPAANKRRRLAEARQAGFGAVYEKVRYKLGYV